jgi:hypothetical protein
MSRCLFCIQIYSFIPTNPYYHFQHRSAKKTVFSGWKSPHPRRFTPTPSSEFRRLHTQKNEPRLPRGQQLLFELAIKLP